MPPPRLLAVLCTLLAAGLANASEGIDLQVSLVLVEACTVHSDLPARATPIRVDCSADLPYRLEPLGPAAAPPMPSGAEHNPRSQARLEASDSPGEGLRIVF